MPAVVVDVSASAEGLGYRPTVTLKDGLARTWQYFQQQ
jgi:UDP-glucose 4-epimerase